MYFKNMVLVDYIGIFLHVAILLATYCTCKIFLSATCTLDETDKHFSHQLLLYFAFFVKWVKSLTYLRNAKSL